MSPIAELYKKSCYGATVKLTQEVRVKVIILNHFRLTDDSVTQEMQNREAQNDSFCDDGRDLHGFQCARLMPRMEL